MSLSSHLHKSVFFISSLVILCGVLLCGCDAPIREPRLTEISARLDSRNLSREEALEIRASLDSLPSDSLNEAEQNLRAFLSIKADDKAFAVHSTDTLYLKVREYFRRHHTRLYPEVLYYGGRLYSDMGDYPEALRHYADALEKTGKGSGQMKFRATVLSQTAYLLNSLRLYEPALEHLEEAIQLDSILNDTLNMVYDLQLGASIANRQKDYGQAYRYSLQAQALLPVKDDTTFSITNDMNLARTSYKMGEIGEAVKHIRRMPVEMDSIVSNEAHVIAAEIYLAAGIKDTALLLVQKIIDSNRPLNRHNAYHLLLSDSLTVGMEPDTLRRHLRNYHKALEKYYDNNSNEAALMQHSLYNYARHERMRREAEERNVTLIYAIGGILLAFSLTVTLLIWIKYRQQKEINELKDQLKNLETLKTRLEAMASSETQEEGKVKETEEKDVAALRQELKERLLALAMKAQKEPYQVDKSIVESEPYQAIRKKVEAGQPVQPEENVWKRLENEVSKTYPDFMDNLRLLVGHRLTTVDINTALMVKCGFRPTEMMGVFSISKGAIVSRRTNLAAKIFGDPMSTQEIDAIIRRL